MTHRSNRTLQVAGLARVEGEGALHVRTVDGEVDRVELNIYEPPRFFEAFLRGRHFREPPDITARICGICPVAYQMSACLAIEDACGVRVEGPLRALRRLLYCGEWISSHALHIYLLHAPDFLGFPDGIALAREHRSVVERGLALKKAGNRIMDLVGGRAIHPVNVRVGGFYRVPTTDEIRGLTTTLRQALHDALATVEWVAAFDFPELEVPHDLMALRDVEGYPLDRGTPHISTGRSFPVAEFGDHVAEHQVPHSTALHARLDDRLFLVGPLARYSLNSDRLSPVAGEAASMAGLGPVCRNPFRSIVVRAVEVVYALEEALQIIDSYERPDAPCVEVAPRAGFGHGITEAPRGLLYHRYELDAAGRILDADIVPPTSQNQSAIEADVTAVVRSHQHLDDHGLQSLCEQTIRNYDPCISCSAHFLDLTRERA
ncbi:Coenzyme F420-reducing hydrogenase, alpha subunit [Lentzea waywayandensis]|uniref:Coenzyme F420-reducing hydrogenase, alpha subunit n=1 Tax=Lentzea waywayandensis TaxID=84724 RepID=A0A1I6D9W0_9PSEU|nr:Ni/Fe hydrogenase subunit alpha [Lentzea waywayandensis]SFR02147.1 Coenzyme F420-reducing hydrogenase, alpha subunit [Lentzea waywayandensis]